MMKYNPKHQVKVEGKMSKEGAEKVGNKLANAALILAIGLSTCAFMIGLSYLLN